MADSSTTEQIACIQRELKLRLFVYPKRVAAGKMTQPQADHELRVMGDILARLKAAEARSTPCQGSLGG